MPAGNGLDKESFFRRFPSVQTATKGSYDPKAAPMLAMYACYKEDYHLYFWNYAAYMKIKIDEPYKKIVLYGESPNELHKFVSETQRITFQDGVVHDEYATDKSETITLVPPSGKSEIEPGIYYICANGFPCVIRSLSIKCYTDDANYIEKKKTFPLEHNYALYQNTVYDLGTITATPAEPEPETPVSTIENFSVSADKEVQFAKGNLYWDGSAFHIENSQLAYSSTWDENHVSHFIYSSDASESYKELFEAVYGSLSHFFPAPNVVVRVVSVELYQKAISNSFDDAPMTSAASGDYTKEIVHFNFKNICSFLKITTTQPYSKILVYEPSSTDFSGGTCYLGGGCGIGNAAEGTVSKGIGSNGVGVYLVPSSGSTIPAGTYYVSVIPDTYKDLGVRCYSDKTNFVEYVKPSKVTFARNAIYDLGNTDKFYKVGVQTINGHDFVDLGLTSGTLWATQNMQATSPEDIGAYYMWADTEGNTGDYISYYNEHGKNISYELSQYKWYDSSYTKNGGYTKYGGNSTIDASDDAATKYWGSNCSVPTYAQIKELISECTWTWNSTKKGYTVTSKRNSNNSIFLPITGHMSGQSLESSAMGWYWSSTCSGYYAMANCLRFDTSGPASNSAPPRCVGMPIRPVYNK